MTHDPNKLQCEDWTRRGTKGGIPQHQCSRPATDWFRLWPDDPTRTQENFYCHEHALRNEREASQARVPFRRVRPIPPEFHSLTMLRTAPIPETRRSEISDV